MFETGIENEYIHIDAFFRVKIKFQTLKSLYKFKTFPKLLSYIKNITSENDSVNDHSLKVFKLLRNKYPKEWGSITSILMSSTNKKYKLPQKSHQERTIAKKCHNSMILNSD